MQKKTKKFAKVLNKSKKRVIMMALFIIFIMESLWFAELYAEKGIKDRCGRRLNKNLEHP